MTTGGRKKAAASMLRIEGEMTIYRAFELKQALFAELETSAVLELDLANVTELDTAGVQLLLLARKSAQAGQRQLRLGALSPAVAETLGLLGLSKYFVTQPVTSLISA
jgi:anti-sigma B factor antagonist